MNDKPKISFRLRSAGDKLESLFDSFLKNLLGEFPDGADPLTGNANILKFTADCRDAVVRLANEAYEKSQYMLKMVSWGEAWDKGEASPEQMLEVYLFDYCWSDALYKKHISEMKGLPYQDFLKTEYWSIVRLIVLERHGGTCAVCLNPDALHVHHRTYAHHGREHECLDDLIPLCQECHAKFHDKPTN